MKIFLVCLYLLAVLFTCHQATYWGHSAASCPLKHPEWREHYILLYYLYGISFLVLMLLPLLRLLYAGIKCLLKRLR